MEYMEQQMQQQIEAGLINAEQCHARIAELEEQNAALAAQLVAIQDAALKPRGKTRQQWIDNIKRNALSITARDHLRQVRADAVSSLSLDCYDAGYLNDFGGGNVEWWQDYIRSELASAHHFCQSQVQQYADIIRQEK